MSTTINHGQIAKVDENGNIDVFYPKTFSKNVYVNNEKDTLENFLGCTDISNIGDGSITGALSTINIKCDIDKIHPIGSIYMSVDPANPSTIFIGTTWVSWGSGRVPVGVSADSEFDTVEKTGGDKSVTLTAAQSGVPAHSHGLNGHAHGIPELRGITLQGGEPGNHTHIQSTVTGMPLTVNNPGSGAINLSGSDGANNGVNNIATSGGLHAHDIKTYPSTTGGNYDSTANNSAANASQSHTNLQPYITCYMWKRTA